VRNRDPIFVALNSFLVEFEEMRRIRDHIAHNNSDTRAKYRDVVRVYYGSSARAIPPGKFLISEKKVQPSLLESYMLKARAFGKVLTRS